MNRFMGRGKYPFLDFLVNLGWQLGKSDGFVGKSVVKFCRS
jgi:hypothetical protein